MASPHRHFRSRHPRLDQEDYEWQEAARDEFELTGPDRLTATVMRTTVQAQLLPRSGPVRSPRSRTNRSGHRWGEGPE